MHSDLVNSSIERDSSTLSHSYRDLLSHDCVSGLTLCGWGDVKGFEFPITFSASENTLTVRVACAYYEIFEKGHFRVIPVHPPQNKDELWSEIIEQLEGQVDYYLSQHAGGSDLEKLKVAWVDSMYTGACVYAGGMVKIKLP